LNDKKQKNYNRVDAVYLHLKRVVGCS